MKKGRLKTFQTTFFSDYVWEILDQLCGHTYNLIHRGSEARYGKSPTEAGLLREKENEVLPSNSVLSVSDIGKR